MDGKEDKTMAKSKTYEVYLMDVDNTILDFSSAQKVAFGRMLEDFGHTSTPEIYALYCEINRGLWRRMDKGELERSYVLHNRFRFFAERLGIALDAREANCSYLTHLSYNAQVIPGAKDILERLQSRYRLAIASNGVDFVQQRRLKTAGFLHFFEQIVVSESLGVSKPNPRFFAGVLAMMGNPDPSKVLMVGDNPNTDIEGALAFGIDACLYDPEHKHEFPEATYHIDNLIDIPGLP